MKLSHRVRISVSGPETDREPVLESARTSLRSRLLRRLVGDSYAVLVITPKGRSVRSVEIHELPPDAA